jgi:hypothetical protein
MNRIVESQAYATLKTRPYAMALFSILAAENGPDAEFWIANGLADALGWPRRSIQEGRRTLLQLGIVECVRRERQGRPAVYRWAAQDPADADPGLPYLVGYPSSPSPCYPALGSAAERPPEAVMTRPQIATDDPATAGGRDHAPASLCIPGPLL